MTPFEETILNTSASIGARADEIMAAFRKYKTAADYIYKNKIPKPPKMQPTKANWLLMTWYWFFEELDKYVYFDTDSNESYDIAHSFSMKQVIKEYYKTKKIPKGWGFDGPGTATGEYGTVEWFLGSYEIQNFKLRNRIATFSVYNKSGWHSGTRLPVSWQNEIKQRTGCDIKDLVTDAKRGEVLKTKFKQKFPEAASYIPSFLMNVVWPSFGGTWEQEYNIEMEWSNEY